MLPRRSKAAIGITLQRAYTPFGQLRLTSIETRARTHFWWCPYRLLTRYFPPTGTHLYARQQTTGSVCCPRVIGAERMNIRQLAAHDAPYYQPLRLRALREHPEAFGSS